MGGKGGAAFASWWEKLALDAERLGVVFKSPLSRSRRLQDVYTQLVGLAIVHQVPGCGVRGSPLQATVI